MANKYTAITDFTPVQFYVVGKEQPNYYHQKLPGFGWKFSEQLGAHENKVDYAQPWQFGDLVPIQIRSHLAEVNNNVVTLEVLDLDGNVLVSNIAYVWSNQFTSDTEEGLQMTVYQFKFWYSGYGQLTQSGTQYVRFQLRLVEDNGVDDPTTELWQSEILQFKEEQPDTHLIEYSNKHNKPKVIFNEAFPQFRIRLNSWVHDLSPGFESEYKDDDDYNLLQVDDDVVNTYKFSFKDAPEYIINKINHILTCDRIRIDGVLFSKAEGTSWELTATPNHPIKGGTITVRKKESEGFQVHSSSTFNLWPQGSNTYPKYLYSVIISDGVKFLELKEIILANSGAGTTLATSLNNAATAAANGTYGTFSYVDHALVYTQNPGETWASHTDYVFTEKLTLDVTINISNGILGWKDRGFSYGIDWGDGTIRNTVASNAFNPKVEIIQHEYASTGNYQVRLFHPGTGGWCNFNYPSDSNYNTHCTITGIGGTLPQVTSQFFINGNNGQTADLSGMSAADFNFLQSARQEIANIILFNCKIDADIGQIFVVGTANQLVATFPKLRSLTLTNNQLSATQAANVINQFAAYCNPNFFIPNGIIRLKQNPAAVIVDATALATYSVITNNPVNWTVEKD